ncbi:replication-associated recombination protein A [Spongiibacter tropicus]|uniref:replication-associated recombination protein A n=2 Tax=Spongiibacteraceae TaxID=1706375 RepID=UPI0003B5C551|nr:replication-associated recombination protein A [Spongiibacter tropicus]MAY39288.1 replication-associated recombination protein A [Spongiibacter sp.]MBI59002.1 replication-associated recombination protein A [Spongiibacter sp.]|tara:strand:+ start:5116 stop:6414 length:1299 start_codon:yes stop_codon:yes gene_type:complete
MTGTQAPLAARMRPASLADYRGQQHLLGEGQALRRALDAGQLHSMIFWGPPGVGKTTLARLIAQHSDAHFLSLSAVLAGVKDIRKAVEVAQQEQRYGRRTVLFIDEVHRFNKAQQDAFLPYVEDGTLIFVGATTENPSFEINNALLSRARVYPLRALDTDELLDILQHACAEEGWQCEPVLLEMLARQADGDARRALNLLELAMDVARDEDRDNREIGQNAIDQALSHQPRRFDKGGDLFYEQISALHKSVRGSSPDGALYWLLRMLDGGCDPIYIARRLVRMASEDIGNADPRALRLCLDAWDVQERLGSPEGELALAQAVSYLAAAPKSNAVYTAFNALKKRIAQDPSYDVPMHLRNAPTKMMKGQGFGEGYRYAHDEPGGYAAGENYLPEALHAETFYHPVDRGLEKKIGEKLRYLQQLDADSPNKRYS